jgi:hypothetical protein
MSKQYLKMAEVFVDEVVSDSDCLLNKDLGEIADFSGYKKQCRYAAHAINSHDELVAEVEHLKMQRDELLSALESIHHMASESTKTHNMMVICERCTDAIAKVKGGAEIHSPDARKMVVPKGWQLVPAEPTFDMKKSASKFQIGDDDLNLIDMSFEEIECIYKAMLASAPKPQGGAS